MRRLTALVPLLAALALATACGPVRIPHEPAPPGTPRAIVTGTGPTAGWTVDARSVPAGIEVTVSVTGPVDVPTCRPLRTWLEDASGRTVVPVSAQNWMCARLPDIVVAKGATVPLTDTMRVTSPLPAGSYTIRGRLRTSSGDLDIPPATWTVP